jgi:thymidylate synthase
VGIVVIEAPTLGEGWLAVSRGILEDGAPASYDGHVTRELAHVSVSIADPSPDDEIIARLGDPPWLDWMHANFFDHRDVAELGYAKSYAVRLFDYAGSGRDQLAWVVDRLRADPECRSAAITTFQPLTDTSYVPCVSMLDFWLRDGAVELVVYAHSLDFGKKAYGNLVELARLQERVAGELGLPVGRLTVLVKSAHVYEPELELMERLAAEAARPRKGA